jgi:Amidohydrolase family
MTCFASSASFAFFRSRCPFLVLVGALSFFLARTARAQPVAFVNVNVIPMDRERVEIGQTVVVRGDRIEAVGASGSIAVPAGATVIDASGRYLLPGLTDAHVHLMGFGPGPKENFADGPAYLRNGITTVISMGGPNTPTRAIELDWKRRVAAGTLTGPTIYTAGAFVNEPAVTTPDEVERLVRSEVHDGYDVIKFHELGNTTIGLSLASYRRMIDTARELGVPIVGHAPNRLGVDVMLEARQPLAHVGNLANIYFLPLASHHNIVLATATAFFVLIATVALSGAPPIGRWIAVAVFAAFVCFSLFLPGGPLYDSLALRIVVTALTLFVVAGSIGTIVVAARTWRDARSTIGARLRVAQMSVASVTLALVLAFFWIPVGWRSTTRAIEALAARLHERDISVQTTLVVYETIGGFSPLYRLPAFQMKVAGALHRAGVMLVAGTDARGIPQLPPAVSLHRELELLVASGLTRYEAIRAATVAPALFLRKDGEFGTVDPGKRADLLLVNGNPLQDLSKLREPIGVMVRGKWTGAGELSPETRHH